MSVSTSIGTIWRVGPGLKIRAAVSLAPIFVEVPAAEITPGRRHDHGTATT
jgi:hypothetical protein